MNTAIVVGPEDRRVAALLVALGLRVNHVNEEGVLAAFARAEAEAMLVVDAREKSSVPGWVAGFRRQFPSQPVLMLVSALEPALILEAMRAGVNECVAEPLSEADARAALARLQEMRAPAVAGQVFAFLGAKGGVGTTTTAVNVATALAGLPAPTLFIDLHLAHGDAAVFLGLEPRFSVVDALENMNRLDAAYFKGLVVRGKRGPDLLASSDRSFVGSAAMQHIRQLVEFAARQYRYVILDVPRAEAAALDALDLTTRILIVANQELPTVRNASRIAEALRRRYGKDRVGVLLTRYDPEAQIGQEDVERVTGVRLAGTIPNDYRLALQALNAGRPLMIENHNKLAASLRHLARALSGVSEGGEAGEVSSGLLNRLLGRRS